MEGNAMTEYASLSGKIHSLVIDKSLSISGAAADSKAVGDVILDAKEQYEHAKEDIEAGMKDAVDNLRGYTKEESVTDTTKAMYGLGAEAVPDNVLAWIGENGAKVIKGSYVGTGLHDAANPNVLEFDRTPLLLFVYLDADSGGALDGRYGSSSDYTFYRRDHFFAAYGTPSFKSWGAAGSKSVSDDVVLAWEEKKVSWYADTGYSETSDYHNAAASCQLNTSGYTYKYIAVCV